MNALLVAVGFLTRIPVPLRVFADPRAPSRSLAWYPAVGVLLGLLLCALAWALRSQPPLLAAAVVLLAWVGLTGALHLDGLADSADAWLGGLGGEAGESRARTLAIMKDPCCGPAGVVALALVLLAKFAALASLPAAAQAPAVVLAPWLARTVLPLAFISTPYVRAGGLGSALAAAPRGACIAAIALALLAAAGFGLSGALAIAVVGALFVGWRRACLHRLGGFTGDTAGALVELVEAGVLLALALAE